jgi:hypothetical protein
VALLCSRYPLSHHHLQQVLACYAPVRTGRWHAGGNPFLYNGLRPDRVGESRTRQKSHAAALTPEQPTRKHDRLQFHFAADDIWSATVRPPGHQGVAEHRIPADLGTDQPPAQLRHRQSGCASLSGANNAEGQPPQCQSTSGPWKNHTGRRLPTMTANPSNNSRLANVPTTR